MPVSMFHTLSVPSLDPDTAMGRPSMTRMHLTVDV